MRHSIAYSDPINKRNSAARTSQEDHQKNNRIKKKKSGGVVDILEVEPLRNNVVVGTEVRTVGVKTP